MRRSSHLPLWFACLQLLPAIVTGRFALTGPVVSLTLRERASASAATSTSSKDDGDADSDEASKRWLNMDSLHPTALWTLDSTRRPLPNWFPALKSLKTNLAYRYDDLKRMPSFVETDAAISTSVCDLNIQPSYEFRSKRVNLLVMASRGASYAMARFATRGDRWLEFAKGCCTVNFPRATASSVLGGIRVTPAYDFLQNEASCKVEATTGTQRTKAVLDLESRNPTVSIVHALDERHTIAPVISLRDAKITYQWSIALSSGSIRAKVDPTSAVYLTWTDKSTRGTWVTDLRLPLEGTTVAALSADVQIRRQFVF